MGETITDLVRFMDKAKVQTFPTKDTFTTVLYCFYIYQFIIVHDCLHCTSKSKYIHVYAKFLLRQ
jgi:hypothetical protein